MSHIVFYIFLLTFIGLGLKFNRHGFWEDFSDKRQTTIINGIFIVRVFSGHLSQYLPRTASAQWSWVDWITYCGDQLTGQWIVVMFLFYSGYGVVTSILKKNGYLGSMPKRRILKTLLNFDVAVCAFAAAAIFLGCEIGIRRCLESLVGWSSFGNSNWYVCMILICYLLVYISYSANKKWAHFAVLVEVLFVISIISRLKDPWWYNTLMAFPAGVFYASYKNKFDMFFQRHYWSVLIGLVATYILLFPFARNGCWTAHNVVSVSFAFIILLFTMKCKIDNGVLYWLGSHLFPIYIYQRLPMIILAATVPCLTAEYQFLYLCLCSAITICIAALYPKWEIRIK